MPASPRGDVTVDVEECKGCGAVCGIVPARLPEAGVGIAKVVVLGTLLEETGCLPTDTAIDVLESTVKL